MSTFVSSVSVWTQKMCPKARLYSTKVVKIWTDRQTDEHHFLNVFHTKAPRGNHITRLHPQGRVAPWSSCVQAFKLRAYLSHETTGKPPTSRMRVILTLPWRHRTVSIVSFSSQLNVFTLRKWTHLFDFLHFTSIYHSWTFCSF